MATMRTTTGLIALLTLGCVGLVGCGGGEKGPPDVKRAHAVLNAGAGDDKQAIKKFVEEEGLPGLKRQLESDSSEVRMLALTGIGMLKGNAEATQVLLKYVNGEDSQDAYWALMALGYQGAPEAKEAIEKAFQGKDAHRRAGACLAIKEYGDTSLYPLLDAAMSDEDFEVKRTAEKMKVLIARGQVVQDGKAVETGEGLPEK